MKKISKSEEKTIEEILKKEFRILIATSQDDKYKLLEQNISGLKEAKIIGRATNQDEMISSLNNNEIDIVILTTDLKCKENLMYITNEIPQYIRIIAIDTIKINYLIYGKMEVNGVEFINLDEIEDIKSIIQNKTEDEDEEKDKKTKKSSMKEKSKSKNNKIQKLKLSNSGIIKRQLKNVSGLFKDNNTQETKEVKITPQVQMKEVIRKLETTRHHVIEKIHIQKDIIAPKDYQKVVAVVGDREVGKTFITSTLLRELEERKKIVSGVDFTSNRGLYHFFKSEEDEDGLNKLINGVNDPWLESPNLAIYTSNPEIEVPKVKGGDFFHVIENIKRENNIVLVDFKRPESEEELNLFKEYLMICDQVLFILNPDPLKILEQIKLFVEVLEVTSIFKLNVVINNYTKSGLGKSQIRNKLQEVSMEPIREMFMIELNKKDIEYTRKGLTKEKFKFSGLSRETKKTIKDISSSIYPKNN
ncbi:hypothetical protein [Sporosalibacterium faouarense]|uniref:hypothetical protein n=1 Tax=Sporosalibacterium faouarense TaxID=516123 RepID=UPI00192CD976|nr:hypothetical protein [Sporosalibacterium faouarense]